MDITRKTICWRSGLVLIVMLCAACHPVTDAKPNTPASNNDESQKINGCIEPKAILSILVKADGAVGDIKILQSSDDPNIDEKLVDFYHKYAKFKPALRDGNPIDSWKTLAAVYREKNSCKS